MVESGAHRPGRLAPGHHRRRHHVLQPRGHGGPAVPARRPRRAADPGRVSDLPGPRRRRRPVLERRLGRPLHRRAPAGAGPAMSGPTDEILAPQQPGFPVPPRSARSAALLGGVSAGPSGAPPLLGLRHAGPEGVLRVRALRHAGGAGLGAERGPRIPLQLDGRVARPTPGLRDALRPGGGAPRRGLVDPQRRGGVCTWGTARRSAPAGRVPSRRRTRSRSPTSAPSGPEAAAGVPLRPDGEPNPGGDPLRSPRPGSAACPRRPRCPS